VVAQMRARAQLIGAQAAELARRKSARNP
jgi:hypothetical protein